MSDFTDLTPAATPTPGTPGAQPAPIAPAAPGADTAPQTIDTNVGPDTDPDRSIASMLDEAEDRLDEAERTVADLLVQRMTDIPIDREDINLSDTGDSTRPTGTQIGATPAAPAANAPVVAAVDMSKQGGFDEAGVWHDGLGRFARKGWSGLKHAALELVSGQAARNYVDDRGPTKLRIKDRRLAHRFPLDDTGMVTARFGDREHALVRDMRDRDVRVPWSAFDESTLRPASPMPILGMHRGITNEMAERPWHLDGPTPVTPKMGDRLYMVVNGRVTDSTVVDIDAASGRVTVANPNKPGNTDWASPTAKFYEDRDAAVDAAGRSVFADALATDSPPPADGGGWRSYVVEMRHRKLSRDISRQEQVDSVGPAVDVNTPAIRARSAAEALSKAGASTREWPTGRVRAWGDDGPPETLPVLVGGNPVDPETGQEVRGPGRRPTLDDFPGRPATRTAEFTPPTKEQVKFGRKQYGATDWSAQGTGGIRDSYGGSLRQNPDGTWESGGAEPAKNRYDAVVNDMRAQWETRNPDPQAAVAAEQAKILAEREARLADATERWQAQADEHGAALARLGIDQPVVNEMPDHPDDPIVPTTDLTPDRLATIAADHTISTGPQADGGLILDTNGSHVEMTWASEAHVSGNRTALVDTTVYLDGTPIASHSDHYSTDDGDDPHSAALADLITNPDNFDTILETTRTRNTGQGTGGPTVNELTTRPTPLQRARTTLGLPTYDIHPPTLPTPARLHPHITTYTGNDIRDLALMANGGVHSPAAERIAAGDPIIDVAWTETGELFRTPGILDADNGFLPAGGPERLLQPKGLDMAPEAIAEAVGRSLAGWGTDVRVRRAGDLDGRLVYLGGPTVNELAVAPTVVPPLDDEGRFATLDRVTEDALVWATSTAPMGATALRTSIVGQYQGDGPGSPLNAINVEILDVPRHRGGLLGGGHVKWSVDAANPITTKVGQWDARYAVGNVDPYSWDDPLAAPSWVASGYSHSVEAAKADIVWEVNNLPAAKTFRPLNMDHTVDGPAAAARAVDTIAGQENLFDQPVTNEMALRDPNRPYAERRAAYLKGWNYSKRGYSLETADDKGHTSDPDWEDGYMDYAVGREQFAFLDHREETLAAERSAPISNELVDRPDGDRAQAMLDQLSTIDDLASLSADQLATAVNALDVPDPDKAVDDAFDRVETEVFDRGLTIHYGDGPIGSDRLMVGRPEDFMPIQRTPEPVVVLNPTPSGPSGPSVTASDTLPERNSIIREFGNAVSPMKDKTTGLTAYSVNTSGGEFMLRPRGGDPTERFLSTTEYTSVYGVGGYRPTAISTATADSFDENVLTIYGEYGDNIRNQPGITGTHRRMGVAGQVNIDGDNAALYSGSVVIPVPNNVKGDAQRVAEWAATVIGDSVSAVGRVRNDHVDPITAIAQAVQEAPTPHGVVLVRGSMFQPFFDAPTVAAALRDARTGVGGQRFDRQGSGPVATKVLILDEKTAARWRAAYDGVLADTERFKATRKEWQAARKAARQAQQQVLPTSNDLVDMPPLDRARAQSPTLLVTRDNYLSRLGVEKGQAVAVRYVTDDTGAIDVLDGDQIRPQDVKWDRFADTAPAGAPRVDVPEVTGNAAVRGKAEAAQATARRVQAAGTGGAPVEVADSYLARYGAPKGSIVTVSYLDEQKAVLNVEGRQRKVGWDRFTQRVPVPTDGGWALEEAPVEPVVNELADDDSFRTTVLRQIGSMNVMAISGGRVEMIHDTSSNYADGKERTEPIGVRLPVAAGYRVDVVLDQATDTYTVNRVFVRSGKEYPKGTMSGVYADQVGDIAYAASIYHEPFGTAPAPVADGQLNLLDLAPTEVRAITSAAPEFTGRGWYPTDAIGGFRSPDGNITVTRTRGSSGQMFWRAVDRRTGLFTGTSSIDTGSVDSIFAWQEKTAKWYAVTPVDTAKLVDDDTLAGWAADPGVVVYPTSGMLGGDREGGSFGILARSSDWHQIGGYAFSMPDRVQAVVGRWKTPGEAQGAYEDLRRRLAQMDLADRPAAAPTTAYSADVKASAVKHGDWVVAVQGADDWKPGRVEGIGTEPDGRVNLTTRESTATVPDVATVAIHRPVGVPMLGDDPKATDAVSPAALAAMTPDQLAAVRRVAADQASATPIGSPANAQAVSMVASIDDMVVVRNEMAARPMRDFNVEMTTDTGGRFVDTVKARTTHEAMQRANRANGHYTGGRWYAVTAAPDAPPITNEIADPDALAAARARYQEIADRRDALRRQAHADGRDPNTAPGVKAAEQAMDQARAELWALQGLDADGAPISNEMAPAPLPDYLGTRNEPSSARRAAAPGMGSADGKDVVETSIRLGAGDLPPKPGTAAIPEDTVRLYHYPQTDPDLSRTLRVGVTAGDDQPVWAQTRPPVADVVPYVEFWAPQGAIAAGGPGYGHVALTESIPPGNIVSYNTPTVDALRHLRSLDWGYDRLAALRDRYPLGSPERVALEARLAELGMPDTAEFRPFDMLRRKVPSKAMLVALARTGVPNGDGRVLTEAEIEAMTPTELRSLDRAMTSWLAAHPYGDYSGADPLDTSIDVDRPDDPNPEPAPKAQPKPRALPENGGMLGYLPMSPLDAPGDWGIAAGLDLVDVPLYSPLDDVVDVPMADTVTDVPLAARAGIVAALPLPADEHARRAAAARVGRRRTGAAPTGGGTPG